MEYSDCPALCLALCLALQLKADNSEDEEFFNDVD